MMRWWTSTTLKKKKIKSNSEKVNKNVEELNKVV